MAARRNRGRRPRDEAQEYATITPGAPGRCPECNGFGYIDHADLVYHFQIQHCRECGHRWEYRFDDEGTLLEVVDLPDPDAEPTKVRYIDVTDERIIDLDAEAAEEDQATSGDETYAETPGEWLRKTARR